MKKISLIICLIISITLNAQDMMYQGMKVIKASSMLVDCRMGNSFYKEYWLISPQIKSDTLTVTCYNHPFEYFCFYTDIDSISLEVVPDKTYRFYVLLKNKEYALTTIIGKKSNWKKLQFDTISVNDKIRFEYEDDSQDNPYLLKLRKEYNLDSIISGAKNDIEKSCKLMRWVHDRWKHNGNNTPQNHDALSILKEAKNGKKFRCVEYAIVLSACLNSIGLKSRRLALKKKNVETAKRSAGHVVTEAYMNDIKKWVYFDAQFDVIYVLNDLPLNAVEIQKSLVQNYSELEIISSLSFVNKRDYSKWVYPYLYFFDVPFDNRVGINLNRKKILNKSSLMLVPIGTNNPKVFQQKQKIDKFLLYTNSIYHFYQFPNI